MAKSANAPSDAPESTRRTMVSSMPGVSARPAPILSPFIAGGFEANLAQFAGLLFAPAQPTGDGTARFIRRER